MKRTLRYLWRILAIIGVPAAILLAVYVFILPGYVESTLRDTLAEAGFTEADLDLAGVTTSHLHVANLSLAGDPQLGVGAVDVTYSLGMLWNGRVDTVTLTGVVWDAAYKDGRLDLGALEQLQSQDDTASTGSALPFNRIALRSSLLRVNVAGQTWYIPVDGRITQTGDGLLSVQMTTRVRDQPVELTGTITQQTDTLAVELSAVGQFSDASWALRAGLEYKQDAAGKRLALKLDAQAGLIDELLAGRRVRAEGLRIAADVALIDNERIDNATVDLTLKALAIDGQQIQDIALSSKRVEDQLECTLTAAPLEASSASITIALPAQLSRWESPTLQLPVVLDSRWTLPRSYVDQLGNDIDLSEFGAMKLSGQATVYAGRLLAMSGQDDAGASPMEDDQPLVSFDEISFLLAPCTIGLPGAGVELQQTSADVRLEGALTARELRLQVWPGGWLRTHPLKSDASGQFAAMQAVRVDLSHDLETRLVWLWRPAGTDAVSSGLSLLIDAALEDTVNVEAYGVVAALTRMRLQGLLDVKLGGSGEMTFKGQVGAAVESAQHDAGAVSLRDVELDLPINWRSSRGPATEEPEPLVGTFSVGAIKWRDIDLPGLKLQTNVEDNDAWLSGQWALADNAPIEIVAKLNARDEATGPEVTVKSKMMKIKPDSPLAKLADATLGAETSGAVAIDARLAYGGAGDEARIIVEADELALRWPDGEDEAPRVVEGIDAKVEVNQLNPIRTVGGNTVKWKRAQFGKAVLSNGMLRFAVEGPDSILCERLRFEPGEGGRGNAIWAHAFRVDTGAPEIRAELFWENVEIKHWLPMITFSMVTGEGRLGGRLPIVVRTQPGVRVRFGRGSLRASDPGVLKLLDTETAEELVADKKLIDLGSEDLSEIAKQRLIEAMTDFGFTDLRFDFEGEDDQVLMRVFTKGRGRTGARQEVGGINMAVRGAGEFLNLTISGYLGLKKRHDFEIE